MNYSTGFQFCNRCHQGMGCGQAQKCLGVEAYRANVETLRDKFAMAALGGIVLRRWEDANGDVPADIHERWAKAAYATADAMLKEREK